MASNYISDEDKRKHEPAMGIAVGVSGMLTALRKVDEALHLALKVSEQESVTEDEMWELREKTLDALRSLQQIPR